MIKITFLGTGSAMARNKSNSCFIIQQSNNMLLVDCGGGHEILRLLEDNKIQFQQIDAIFLTHPHIDHIYGMPFLYRRMIELNKKIKILCSLETKRVIETLIKLDIPKYFEKYKELLDYIILGEISFYHNLKIFAVNKNQHGFILDYNKKKIAFTGDVPAHQETINFIKKCNILIHEAFCSENEDVIIRGHHSTIENAINISEQVDSEKLLVTHHFTDLSMFNSDKIKVVQDGEIVII